jgi:hypothetical protein
LDSLVIGEGTAFSSVHALSKSIAGASSCYNHGNSVYIQNLPTGRPKRAIKNARTVKNRAYAGHNDLSFNDFHAKNDQSSNFNGNRHSELGLERVESRIEESLNEPEIRS